ncbi:MAG TPA: hypothetical protein VKE41_02795 [Roseiflexaceae bacterium]|nr:hypothetical protein [Roseiflexaceae bacterium]
MSSRIAGVLLIAAASLFLIAWLLMPSPGVTDAQLILLLVARQRGAVAASVIVQLLSAALYLPAMTSVISHSNLRLQIAVWWPATVFLLGVLGAVADAIIHLLAYAMTAPNLDPGPLVVVMRFMQGPALLLITPLISAFFIGGAWLSVALARETVVSRWNPRLYAIALGVGLLAAVLARGGGASPRTLGLVALGSVSAAQIWVGVALWQLGGQQAGDRTAVVLVGDLP